MAIIWDNEKSPKNTIIWDDEKAKNIPFLPKLQATEEKIDRREDPVQSLKKEMAYHPEKEGKLLHSILQPLVMGQKILNIPVSRGESALASGALALQRQDPKEILSMVLNGAQPWKKSSQEVLGDIVKGATGQRQSQFGDVVRTTGVGGPENELIAALTGLGVQAGIGNVLTKGKLVPTAEKAIAKTGESFISPIKKVREYPKTKVRNIREGLKQARKTETSAYGKTLRTVSKESNDTIPASNTLETMESMLRNKGIFDDNNVKIGTPANESDRQLLKSYNVIMNKFAFSKGGKIPVTDILQEARNIKAKGGKVGTYKSKIASQLHDEIINTIKPLIKSEEFKKANARYARYKEIANPLEEIFKPFENKYKTGKGEKVLTDIFSQPGGIQELLNLLPKVAGQTIKGAKVLSAAQELNPLWWMLKGKRIIP